MSVRERLIRVLLELGEEHGVREDAGLRIDLWLSQQDLADMVEASREKVNRELGRLARRGLIQVERCRITLFNVAALRGLG